VQETNEGLRDSSSAIVRPSDIEPAVVLGGENSKENVRPAARRSPIRAIYLVYDLPSDGSGVIR